VRVADEGFAAYIWGSDFSFEVAAYGAPEIGKPVDQWAITPITPYRKCYGIDPEEFSSYRDAADSAIFMAYLDDEPVGHLVVSTNWNGFAHIDELAVHAPARRHGVAKALAGCGAVLESQEEAARHHAGNPEQQSGSLSTL
jgi:GNAT superfamily N-acetyltransferase